MSRARTGERSDASPAATGVDRRTVLRGTVGTLTIAGVADAAASPVVAQDDPDYGGWFDDVANFDGTTVDRRGEDEVTVTVGAEGNNGSFAYDPPAVMVSPGTTVRWDWTGAGGGHNVVADDGTFDSGDAINAEGVEFEYSFDSEGTFRYVCTPHEGLGMKGAVVVRSGGSGGDGGQSTPVGPPANPDYGGWFDDVSNFDGETVDRTADDAVTVTVGADGNDGSFAYDPPAVRVTPGTTVRWDWTGAGGGHNVVADDGTFDSGDAVDAEGVQFEYTFEEPGIYEYVCTPHEGLGMKGAVVVGGPLDGGGQGGDGGDRGPAERVGVGTAGGAVFLAFAAPLLYALHGRRRGELAVPGATDDASTPTGEPPVTEEAPIEEPAVEVGHDEYDPWGTAALVAVYFAILVLMWVFVYFVEFLGRVSVMG